MGDIGEPSTSREAASPNPPRFHVWPQNLAQTVLVKHLRTCLPHSTPIYSRILAPHNTPDRHCLFAATFPASPTSSAELPEAYTIVFSDRSRKNEAQIWTFNSLIEQDVPLDEKRKQLVKQHVEAAFRFVSTHPIPEAPGWPFDPLVRFDRSQPAVADALVEFLAPYKAVQWDTNWRRYNISLNTLPPVPSLPAGLRYVSPVPVDQLDLVISTSAIPRQKETLASLTSSAIMNEDGNAVAWSFNGVDGSLATLYVMPDYRSKGLAKAVAADLLHKVADGYDFENLVSRFGPGLLAGGPPGSEEGEDWRRPFGKGAGYVFAEVKVGNMASERTMEWLGGEKWGMSRYTFVDSSLVPAGGETLPNVLSM